MSRPQFYFINASSAGQSTDTQRLQRQQVRHHVAVVSAYSRRKSKKKASRWYQDVYPVLGPPAWVSSNADSANGLPNAEELHTPPKKPPVVLDISSATAIPNSTIRASRTSIAPISIKACEDKDYVLHPEDEDLLAERLEVCKVSPHPRSSWEGVTHRQQNLALVVRRYLHALNTNPFNCLAIPGSKEASEVVHYYTHIMAPSHAAIYTIFSVTELVPSSCYFEWFSHDDFLYTGLASVQATYDQLRNHGQKPSRIVLRYLGKAIMHLRRRVEQPGATTDDSIITTVLFLALVTRAIGDLPSHHVQMNLIHTLVASRGGLDNLGHGGFTKCQLMQMDSFLALNARTGTIFADARQPYNPVYPTHPFSGTICALISKIPCGFRELALQRKVALDVLEILSRTAEASRLSMRGTNTRGTSTDLSQLPQTQQRFHDFWESCTCLGAPDDPCTGQPNFEKLLVLAVLMYCMHAFSTIRTITTVYGGSRTKLTSDVRRRWAQNKEEKECLLWIWMVLVDSWRAADERLLPVGVELLKELKGRWGVWEEVQRVMGRFFWNGEFEKRCRGYWSMDFDQSSIIL